MKRNIGIRARIRRGRQDYYGDIDFNREGDFCFKDGNKKYGIYHGDFLRIRNKRPISGTSYVFLNESD